MLKALGGSTATPLLAFSGIPPTDVDTMLASLTDASGNPLGILPKSSIRLFIAKAALLTPRVPPPAQNVASTTTAPGPTVRQVKHSVVLQQTDEITSDVVSMHQPVGYLQHYANFFGPGSTPP